MFKDNFVSDRITTLKRNVADLSTWATRSEFDEREYKARRCELVNRVAIEALTGIEIREKDSKLKPGKSHKAPTLDQISEVVDCIQNLVDGVEKQVRLQFAAVSQNDESDVGIPPEYQLSTQISVNLDAKVKELKEILLGSNSISEAYFNGADCMKISQIGNKIRKDNNIKTALIVGGIVLVVAAGTLTAIFLWRRHKKNQENAYAALEEERDRVAGHIESDMKSDPDMAAMDDVVSSDVPHVNF